MHIPYSQFKELLKTYRTEVIEHKVIQTPFTVVFSPKSGELAKVKRTITFDAVDQTAINIGLDENDNIVDIEFM